MLAAASLIAATPAVHAQTTTQADARRIVTTFCQQAQATLTPDAIRRMQRDANGQIDLAQGRLVEEIDSTLRIHRHDRTTFRDTSLAYENYLFGRILVDPNIGTDRQPDRSTETYVELFTRIHAERFNRYLGTPRRLFTLRHRMRANELARATIAECAARRIRTFNATAHTAAPVAEPPPAATANRRFELHMSQIGADGTPYFPVLYWLQLEFGAGGAASGTLYDGGNQPVGTVTGSHGSNAASGSFTRRIDGAEARGVWQLVDLAGRPRGRACLRGTGPDGIVRLERGEFWEGGQPRPPDAASAGPEPQC